MSANRYSPSQLELFHGCKRAWAFQYALGYKSPSSPALEFGTMIHDQIERYYKSNGETDTTHALASLLVSNCPGPQHGVVAEGQYTCELRPGVDFTGIIDLVDERDPEHVVIIDHKTSSNPSKYAKTEYELRVDIQMMSYAARQLAKHPRAKVATVAHNVGDSKRGGQPRLTKATVTREHVADRWAKHLEIIDDMESIRSNDIRKIPANGHETGRCDKFGGCPHRARCTAADLGQEILPYQKNEENEMPNSNPQGILPPDAPAPGQPQKENEKMPTVAERMAALRAAKDRGAKASEPARVEEPKVEEPKVEEPKVEEPKVEEPKPKKRGRPSKTTAPVVNLPPDDYDLPEIPKKRFKTLYLDCLPSGDVTSFARWSADLTKAIHKNTGVDWQQAEYGKGPGLIKDGLRAVVEALPTRLYVDTQTPIGRVALEVLEAEYDEIVRGVR